MSSRTSPWGSHFVLQNLSCHSSGTVVEGIISPKCWAHTRRNFTDDFEFNGTADATEVIGMISELYAEETKIKGKPMHPKLPAKNMKTPVSSPAISPGQNNMRSQCGCAKRLSCSLPISNASSGWAGYDYVGHAVQMMNFYWPPPPKTTRIMGNLSGDMGCV